MTKLILVALASVSIGTSAFAAERTWTGKISDSMCGAKHMAGEHGKKMTDRECTEMCVKQGASYVFVSSGKVYKLDDPGNIVAAHAGHSVRLTGEMSGDTIKVAKVEMPKRSKG
jgi:hypothetical protein